MTPVYKLSDRERHIFWRALWRSVKAIASGQPAKPVIPPQPPSLQYDPKLFREPR